MDHRGEELSLQGGVNTETPFLKIKYITHKHGIYGEIISGVCF